MTRPRDDDAAADDVGAVAAAAVDVDGTLLAPPVVVGLRCVPAPDDDADALEALVVVVLGCNVERELE